MEGSKSVSSIEFAVTDGNGIDFEHPSRLWEYTKVKERLDDSDDEDQPLSDKEKQELSRRLEELKEPKYFLLENTII